MPLFQHPTAFHEPAAFKLSDASRSLREQQSPWSMMGLSGQTATSQHSHPNLPHLAMLIFEAVLEVVCVSLPGYIVARQGLFTAEMQKFTANLNVALFTPCLVFTKLASQLTAEKLQDLAIIPLIFIVQTLVSFLCAVAVAKACGFSRRPRNFVIAMGVFGNSNSLPISLVLSLSKTIKGLHWDKVPHDNDDEVAARGILYLLIFQQLGQLVRWSWGYNVLLAPPDQVAGTDENRNSQLENGATEEERQLLLDDSDAEEPSDDQYLSGSEETRIGDSNESLHNASRRSPVDASNLASGEQTPITHQQVISSASSSRSSSKANKKIPPPELLATPTNGNIMPKRRAAADTPSAPQSDDDSPPAGIRGLPARCRLAVRRGVRAVRTKASDVSASIFRALPVWLQRFLAKSSSLVSRFLCGVWSFMNPPLWAMLIAVVVASIPSLQTFFFKPGSFVKNSVTSAIESNAGVAVPLILVVLGGNLAGNTLPTDSQSKEDLKDETRLLIASIISRMVLPFAIMAPLLAVTAKYVSVSILDDPIFVIVCFLITGAPSALQLAQICQINNVYMGAMSRLLFQSYVIWILPSTLILVMTALEVVEWAKQ